MKQLLFTLSFGNYICDNVRQSLAAAASRWGCDYLELTNRRVPHLHPCFEKLQFLANEATNWDRVVYVDGDMLVRAGAPSPFAAVPSHKIGVVDDIQPHHSKETREIVRDWVHGCHYPWLVAHVQDYLTFENYIHKPFNGGFLIVNPGAHWSYFKRMVDCFPRDTDPMKDNGHVEQGILNYVIKARGPSDLLYLGSEWNHIGPDIDQPWKEGVNVYHFTGHDFGSRRAAIKTFSWK